MSGDEIEAALQAAFNRCDLDGCPLTDKQKQILLQVFQQLKGSQYNVLDNTNPLDELTPQELQAVLEFVKIQEQKISWKAQLLNDWLQGKDSGAVQFIRDRYGLEWLNAIEPYHFEKYSVEDTQMLRVGSRIEVCNALWEWVQANGPCEPEWFACTVIQLRQISNDGQITTNCVIRFDSGTEYEIQGVYEWNRYNWRWVS
jgi:hypothetical protein